MALYKVSIKTRRSQQSQGCNWMKQLKFVDRLILAMQNYGLIFLAAEDLQLVDDMI